MRFLLVLVLISLEASAQDTPEDLLKFCQNKHIPKIIERNVLIALSHYPELQQTPIDFVFKKHINGSVMQAQPKIGALFKSKSDRGYQINISSTLRLTHSSTPIHQLPAEIMIGWIGHELGHVMDYERRNNWGMLGFGLSYVFSKAFRIRGETVADTFAVDRGLGEYLIATKKFILNHSELPKAYKEKIARLYLSPDAIAEKVKSLEEKRLKQQKKNLAK